MPDKLTLEMVKEYLEKTYPDDDIIRSFGLDIFHGELQYGGVALPAAFSQPIIEQEAVTDGTIICKHINHFGGEGNGENYWGVVRFETRDTTGSVYVKVSGWYASFSGPECPRPEKWVEVQPTRKTITVYEEVK